MTESIMLLGLTAATITLALITMTLAFLVARVTYEYRLSLVRARGFFLAFTCALYAFWGLTLVYEVGKV